MGNSAVVILRIRTSRKSSLKTSKSSLNQVQTALYCGSHCYFKLELLASSASSVMAVNRVVGVSYMRVLFNLRTTQQRQGLLASFSDYLLGTFRPSNTSFSPYLLRTFQTLGVIQHTRKHAGMHKSSRTAPVSLHSLLSLTTTLPPPALSLPAPSLSPRASTLSHPLAFGHRLLPRALERPDSDLA
jgi:hypothetical protein